MAMMPGSEPIVISQGAVKRLVLIQSILSGLQVVSAASVLADMIGGPKYAAFFIVLVAAVQQGVNTYISKSVAEAVTRVSTAVSRAEQVTEQASEQVTAMAAAMPPQAASRALLEQSQHQERKPHDG